MLQRTLPSLDELRPDLGIAPVNTGQKRPLIGSSGIIIDDLESLHAQSDERGNIVLRSGVEFPMWAYRGQISQYRPCVPSLGRIIDLSDQLLALCRNAAFEDAIARHPYVKLCAEQEILGSRLSIDCQGLAQHYGLATDLLDVTTNFDVASFFATCRFDKSSGEYRPVMDCQQTGFLYRLSPVLIEAQGYSCEYVDVGWQPLKRPEQQRAAAIRLGKGRDFISLPSVQMACFRQDPKISQRIWKLFDEGRALFPPDAAADVAAQAMQLHTFTPEQIDRAWNRLETWHCNKRTPEKRRRTERSAGLVVATSTELNWTRASIENNPEILRSQLEYELRNLRWRHAMYID